MPNTAALVAERPDAMAYLATAATEIATEQEYRPESPDQFRAWVAENAAAISERASLNQAKMINHLFNSRNEKAYAALRTIMMAIVWARINCSVVTASANQTINAALAPERV